MIKLYIDESGNLGKQGDFFVIAVLVTKNGKRIKNLVKRYCAENKIEEMKSRGMSVQHKESFLQAINKNPDHYFSYVCLRKSALENKKLYEDKNVLFNFILSHVLKKIVKRHTEEDIHVCIDNRTQKVSSLNSLSDYIKAKALGEWGYNKEFSLKYCDSKEVKLVQVADVAAGTILERYKRKRMMSYPLLTIRDSVRFPYRKFDD